MSLAFAVLDLTGSVIDLGIVLAAQTIPLMVFVLIGGVWSDRLPRRLVMLVSDIVRTVAQGASAGLLLTGAAHVWELAVLQASTGPRRPSSARRPSRWCPRPSSPRIYSRPTR